MFTYLEAYKDHFIFIIIIVLVVSVLHIVTYYIDKLFYKNRERLFKGTADKPIKLLKTTLNTLWLVLGIIAISFVFVDRSKDKEIFGFFKVVSYVGVIAVITIVAATVCNIWFKNKIKDKIINADDPTSFKFLRYVALFAIAYIGILLGLIAFPSFRTVAQTALGSAGLIVVIAGVASQEALSNIVGGLFIIIFKPFKIGDVIKISTDIEGKIVEITMRHTIIKSFENKMIVIPNAIINKEKLINYDLKERKNCEFIEINILYDGDIDLAKKIMREECESHPLIYDNRSELEKKDGKSVVETALINLNENSMTIRAWAWSDNFADSFKLKTDVLESIKKRFDIEGIRMTRAYTLLVVPKEKEN